MKFRKRGIVIAFAVTLAGTAALTSVALASGKPSHAHARTAAHARTVKAGVKEADTDNIQEGDQTTPDTGTSGDTALAVTTASKSTKAAASESSSEGESSQEPAGEPTPGHEDPDGQDVNHDCSPENPSGCDTAAGELP